MTSQQQLPVTLQKYLNQFRKDSSFDPKEFIIKKANILNKYMHENKLKACVVSVSGGVDSSVIAMLANYASKIVGSPIEQIIYLSQPIHSTASVCNRAYSLINTGNTGNTGNKGGGIDKIITIDQTSLFDQLSNLVKTETGLMSNKFADGQLKSYMRTPVNYYTAQLLSSNGLPAIVLGTGNMDEDGYLAYFCKAGDGVVDVQLIADLHKSQVYQVGKVLGVSDEIINAPPTADLWEGQTDEIEMGFPYDFIEFHIELQKQSVNVQSDFFTECSQEELRYYFSTYKKANDIHIRNKHKFNFPINL
jgi:NAD+ synthase (glutamine-hydrolysing)